VDTAVGIINWNSGHWLKVCIQSLLATSGVAEIIIVDNGSTDRSVEGLEKLSDRVQVIRNPNNRGFAGGVNQVFAATRAPLVLILNPDVESKPGAIERLRNFLNRELEAGAIGGDVGRDYPPKKLPTAVSLIRENLGMRRSPSVPHGHEPFEVEQPAAAALMIRRGAFDAVGGFDESFYPAWYEDVDFCRKLRQAHWKIYFDPAAEFVHEGGYSTRVLGAGAFAAAYYRNQLRYVRKHMSRSAALAVRLSIAAGMAGRTIASPRMANTYSTVFLGALGRW